MGVQQSNDATKGVATPIDNGGRGQLTVRITRLLPSVNDKNRFSNATTETKRFDKGQGVDIKK